MHSKDSHKEKAAFRQEIDCILQGRSSHHRPTDRFEFTGFVFPEASFAGLIFERNVDFSFALFLNRFDCYAAQFLHEAYFRCATFLAEAAFDRAQFCNNAYFEKTTFTQNTSFNNARFAQRTHFDGTTFGLLHDGMSAATPIATSSPPAIVDFTGTDFVSPEKVLFHQVNTRSQQGLRVRFVRCSALERIRFEDVHWCRVRGRMTLEDELDVRLRRSNVQNETSGYRCELVGIAYRRLINNWEAGRDYDFAEDCFIGAMEMKRLNPSESLLSRTIISFYKWLSMYGSSYTRAITVLGVLLLIFALSFATLGVRMTTTDARVECPAAVAGTVGTSTISLSCALAHEHSTRELWGAFAAGMGATLEAATFQHSPRFTPATTGGRRMALIETIVVPSQLALFLLALRRRFRR